MPIKKGRTCCRNALDRRCNCNGVRSHYADRQCSRSWKGFRPKRSSGRRRVMSARKSRFIGKILTGLVTTIVAPVLASVVSQQVDGWQQTLKILVDNEAPAAKADWKQ